METTEIIELYVQETKLLNENLIRLQEAEQLRNKFISEANMKELGSNEMQREAILTVKFEAIEKLKTAIMLSKNLLRLYDAMLKAKTV